MNNLTYWVATTIISQKVMTIYGDSSHMIPTQDIPNRAKRITTFVHIASVSEIMWGHTMSCDHIIAPSSHEKLLYPDERVKRVEPPRY